MAKPEKTTELLAVEEQYGFVFGAPKDHETAGAARSMSVSCSNKDCPQVNRPVDLHADTVLPVMCGGTITDKDGTQHACGSVLHCLHEDTLPMMHHEGDLSNPRKITRQVCVVCQSEVSRTTENLPPIAVDKIPLHLLGGIDLGAIAEAQ